jgi:predicted regulator of amino acid metabolism with ACT domain
VVRFLEGREFPMDREEAETLAAEAYGIDRQAVAAAIDHAVKHDRLREAGGKLRQ